MQPNSNLFHAEEKYSSSTHRRVRYQISLSTTEWTANASASWSATCKDKITAVSRLCVKPHALLSLFGDLLLRGKRTTIEVSHFMRNSARMMNILYEERSSWWLYPPWHTSTMGAVLGWRPPAWCLQPELVGLGDSVYLRHATATSVRLQVTCFKEKRWCDWPCCHD